MPYRHCWNCRTLVFHAEVRRPELCPKCTDPLEREPAPLFPAGARLLRDRAARKALALDTPLLVEVDMRMGAPG
jgi:hypothetical protein